jgi:hypothetical protein
VAVSRLRDRQRCGCDAVPRAAHGERRLSEQVGAVYAGIAGCGRRVRGSALRCAVELLGAGDSKRELRCVLAVSQDSTVQRSRAPSAQRGTYRGQEQPRGRGVGGCNGSGALQVSWRGLPVAVSW